MYAKFDVFIFLLVISSSPTVLLRFMDGSIDPRFNWLQDLSGKISGKNRGGMVT